MKMATRYRKPKCYGFDLEKGILFPFSAATDLAADFFLTAIPGDAYTPRQRILFGVRLFSTNDCNGITVVRQHPSSIYPYATRLPQSGWQTSRDFTITQEGDGSQTSTFPDSGYIWLFQIIYPTRGEGKCHFSLLPDAERVLHYKCRDHAPLFS